MNAETEFSGRPVETAQERIRDILLGLEKEIGQRVCHVEVETHQQGKCKTRIFLLD